ncbi:MAG TPA: Rne/Rng family ribonuclease [Terriglobia bacterium]|nr:Rne/Rng family ribonuclease [Terriglobia bacterium]
MSKELLVSSSPHETKVAVLEDDQLVEVYFQRDTDVGLVGGIYKGRVNRVLPGMQSAFVDIGLERDAFLYVSDFFEDSEEYDRVFTEAENRVDKLTAQEKVVAQAASGTEPNAEAAAPQVDQPAPLEPVPPALIESVASVQEEPPSTEGLGNPATAVVPPKLEHTPTQTRPREFPGRRSRRRGRRFRDFKYGSRREPGPPAEEQRQEGHGIELLPGESLAKYSHTTEESSPAPGAQPPESFSEPGSEQSPPEAVEPPPTTEDLASSLDGEDEFETPAETESGSGDPQPVAAVPEPPAPISGLSASSAESPIQSVAEGFTMSHESGATSNPPAGSLQGDETQPLDGQLGDDESNTSTISDEDKASIDLFSESDTETAASNEPAKLDLVLDESARASEAASAAESAPEPDGQPSLETEANPESAEMAAGQSYTLREPSHRPRVAPRHGRRGRGRFRGNQERRRDVGLPRGPEPLRAGNHHPTPISELLKEGQEILVQIAKEPLGAKGARITSHIALPGRYLVYMPTIDHIGVSRKIGSEDERLRLRNILLENRGSLTGGFIVRTAAAGRSEEELKADLAFLTNLWNDIRSKAERIKAPALLHRDLTLVERILRDLLSPDFKCLRVDSEIEYEHILDFVNRFQPSLVGHVKLYTRDAPLFDEFGVQAEIDRALKPKVWLKSGGYIVINQTEALVAIDVNTGKYVGKTNRLEDTIVKTNIDAVKEIVRQIRLRDLGGIVVIDFIDMDERRNRAKVVQALEDALRHDRAPTKILSFNEFGLVALTRKRVKHSLERALCEPCPYCTGAGWVKSVRTVSYDIVSEARKMAAQIEGHTLHLRVNPEVAATLKARDGVLISEIEAATRKDVVIKADPNVHQEQFEIY